VIYNVENTQTRFHVPFGENNIHSFNGKLIRHKTEAVGSTTRVTAQLALAMGVLNSVVKFTYDGHDIPSSDYKFYKGAANETAADAFFPKDVNHPGASFINFRLPQGMALDNKPDKAVGRFKCLELDLYDANGIKRGFNYNRNPGQVIAYGCKIFPDVGINVLDWGAWTEYANWCEEAITVTKNGAPVRVNRFVINYFFPSGITFKQFLDKITELTCSSWQWRRGKIRLIPGKPRAVDATLNLTKLAQEYKFQPLKNAERPNGVLVRWRDLDTPLLEPAEPIIVKRDALIAKDGGVENFLNFNYEAGERHQVQRFANHQARIYCDHLDFCAVRTSFEAYPLLPNDLVNITHTTPNWTNKRCRIIKKEEREDRRGNEAGTEASDTGYKLFLRVEPSNPYSDSADPFAISTRPPSPNPYAPPPPPKANIQLTEQTQDGFDKLRSKTILGRLDFQTYGFPQRAKISIKYPSKPTFESLIEVTPNVSNYAQFIINNVEEGIHTIRAITVSNPFGQESQGAPIEKSITITKQPLTVNTMDGFSAIRRGLIALNGAGQFRGRDGAVVAVKDIRAKIASQIVGDHGHSITLQIHVWVADLGQNHNNSDSITAVEVDAYDQFGRVLVDNLPQASSPKTTVITLQHTRDYADALEGQSYYRIRVFNNYGWSGWAYLRGNTVTTTAPTPLVGGQVPSHLTCHPIDRFRLDINLFSYGRQIDLYYRRPGGQWRVLRDRIQGINIIDASGLQEFTIYEFQCRETLLPDRRSNIVTCRTKQLHNLNDAPIPLNPTAIVDQSNPTSQIIISYISASSLAQTEVWLHGRLNRTEQPVATGAKREITIRGIRPGTTVVVKFRHKYPRNIFSKFTADVSATTAVPKPRVSAPTNLTINRVTNPSTATFTLRWKNNGGTGPFSLGNSAGQIERTGHRTPNNEMIIAWPRESYSYSRFYRVLDTGVGPNAWTDYVEAYVPAKDPPTQGWISGGVNSCFIGSTEVLCANGWQWLLYKLNIRFFDKIRVGQKLLTKRISRLKEGDQIISPDDKGNLHLVKITHKFKSIAPELVKVYFEDDVNPILCTPNHRFHLPGGLFKQVGTLNPGDLILGRSPDLQQIKRVIKDIRVCKRGRYVVYNMHVPPHLTYIAGNCEVHNFKPVQPFDP
jgi:hypothetical protein